MSRFLPGWPAVPLKPGGELPALKRIWRNEGQAARLKQWLDKIGEGCSTPQERWRQGRG
jgi:hypothetical protein